MYRNENDYHLLTSFSVFPDKEPFAYFHRRGNDRPENHPLHIGSGIEFFIPLAGEVDFMLGGEVYSLQHGDVMIIQPNEVHKTLLRAPCLYERFSITMPPNLFEGFLFDPLQSILRSNCVHFTPDGALRAEFAHIIAQIDRLLLDEKNESLAAQVAGEAFSHAMQFVCLIAHAVTQTPAGECRTEERLSGKCRAILTYINEHLAQISSVSMLAETFELSVPYLSSLFKQETGVNLNAYLRARRIGLAKRLLSEGASVTDACFECGFGDCSYFIRCFKEIVGVTPLQFRKQRHFEGARENVWIDSTKKAVENSQP